MHRATIPLLLMCTVYTVSIGHLHTVRLQIQCVCFLIFKCFEATNTLHDTLCWPVGAPTLHVGRVTARVERAGFNCKYVVWWSIQH